MAAAPYDVKDPPPYPPSHNNAAYPPPPAYGYPPSNVVYPAPSVYYPQPPPQQQQQQTSVVVIGDQSRPHVIVAHHHGESYTGLIIFSCVVLWTCNFLFGLIAFALASKWQNVFATPIQFTDVDALPIFSLASAL
jgi:hypothetical protein